MKRGEDNRGFSMVEIIVTIAILVILAATAIRSIAYLNHGNAKKCMGQLESTLDRVQSETLGKETTPYLYVFKSDKGYRMVTSTNKNLTWAELNSMTSTALGGNNLKLTAKNMVTASGTKINSDLSGGEVLRLGFQKSTGAFLSDSYCESIVLTGNGGSTRTLYLVERTGKHYVE
jgi:prepilin-type N-terminal cleavage/methylation domain-containing protein